MMAKERESFYWSNITANQNDNKYELVEAFNCKMETNATKIYNCRSKCCFRKQKWRQSRTFYLNIFCKQIIPQNQVQIKQVGGK